MIATNRGKDQMAIEPLQPFDNLVPEAIQLRPALRRFLARRVPPGDVDDLLQDVFLNLARSRSQAHVANVAAYLFRTAANVVTAHARRQRSMMVSGEPDLGLVDDEGFGADRILISKEELRSVMDDIMALPERSRDVFLLHRFEQMSYPQIARAFGISVSAVEKHMIKALRRLNAAAKTR
ncbi:DNA-directed RNA polymerase sigma-70 factor [Sphingomonas sp. DBB INV C78]|uniref:RNA polymerase sigma factor n=1 Tax=Sphingomonas sp. DBB INV C78 TaxID=3349434 RepID=UPI0036D22A48